MYYVKDCAKGLRYWFTFLVDAQARADATPDHLMGYLHPSHPEMRETFHYNGECEDVSSPARYVPVSVANYGFGVRDTSTGLLVGDEQGRATFKIPMDAVLMARTMSASSQKA